MSKTVQECLANAAASRAAAEAEALEKVRQLHLQAALSWEMLANRAQWVAAGGQQAEDQPCKQGASLRPALDWPSIDDDEEFAEEAASPAPACKGEARVATVFPQLTDALCDKRAPLLPAEQCESPRDMLFSADGNLRSLDQIEAEVIRLAIGLYQGRMAEVARRLGIGRSTLYRKISAFRIDIAGAEWATDKKYANGTTGLRR